MLEKEIEELRQEREWEAIDGKRGVLAEDLRQFGVEKMSFDRWKVAEVERSKNKHLAAMDAVRKDLEDLNLKIEDLERTISHERSELQEAIEREKADAARDLDLKKHELEIDIQNRLREMEEEFQKKVAVFDVERENEMDKIRSMREDTVSEMQKIRAERTRLKKEKEEVSEQAKKLEVDKSEMKRDIEALRDLSQRLKLQREEFMRERDHFLAIVEEKKSVKDNAAAVADFVPSEFEDLGDVLLTSLASEKKIDVASPSGRMSWLRSCTKKIFTFSPGKKILAEEEQEENGNQARVEEQQNNSLLEEALPAMRERTKRERKGKATVKRTHSVQDVVEDAKAFLKTNEGDIVGVDESQGDDRGAAGLKRRRRQTSEIDGRRKRRHTAVPGDRRYNLRRSTV